MKSKFLLIVFSALVKHLSSSYDTRDNVMDGIYNSKDTSIKLCRYFTITSIIYVCDNTDRTTFGGGSIYSRCSNDSTNLPGNAKYLLCPETFYKCNSQISLLDISGSSSTMSFESTKSDELCWYKFTPTNSKTTNINIKIDSLISATVEVYYEPSLNSFTYKGSLTSGNSMDVSISSNNSVWILVTSTSNSAFVSITGTSTVSNSTSSNNPSNYQSNSTDYSKLVTILVPTLVGGFLIIIHNVCIIVGCAIRSKRHLEAIKNVKDIDNNNPELVGQQFESSNDITNNRNDNQAQIDLVQIRQSTYDISPNRLEIIENEQIQINQPHGPIYIERNPQLIKPTNLASIPSRYSDY